jgi:hypothetical protein
LIDVAKLEVVEPAAPVMEENASLGNRVAALIRHADAHKRFSGLDRGSVAQTNSGFALSHEPLADQGLTKPVLAARETRTLTGTERLDPCGP